MKTQTSEKNKNDVAVIMSKIRSNGGNFWATKENGTGKGSPFSTKDVAIMLHELGYKKKDPIIQNIADTISTAGMRMDDLKLHQPVGSIHVIQSDRPGRFAI